MTCTHKETESGNGSHLLKPHVRKHGLFSIELASILVTSNMLESNTNSRTDKENDYNVDDDDTHQHRIDTEPVVQSKTIEKARFVAFFSSKMVALDARRCRMFTNYGNRRSTNTTPPDDEKIAAKHKNQTEQYGIFLLWCLSFPLSPSFCIVFIL